MSLRLPLELPVKLEGQHETTIIVDKLGSEHLELCYSLYKREGIACFGIGVNEFPSLKIFQKKIFEDSDGVFGIFDKKSKELLGVFDVTPSPLCRSEKPVNSAGFVVAAKKGRGIGMVISFLHYNFAYVLGYYGQLSRSAESNIALYKAAQKKGYSNTYSGFIPHSVNVMQHGWTNDMVSFNTYKSLLQRENGHNEPIDLPVIPRSLMSEPKLEFIKPDTWELSLHPISFQLESGETAVLQKASLDQKFQVEKLIQSAAQRADGFGIDEFTTKGLHNRKFFQKSSTLVLLNPAGNLIGSLIFGPSNLCREVDAPILHAYSITINGCRDLEQRLMKFVMDFAKKNDYHGILTDTFRNDLSHMTMLRSLGFVYTGCLPYAGFLKGHGYMDIFVMYKRFTRLFDASVLGFTDLVLDRISSKL